jgi:flagellar biosynthesis/type III secretory pathway protein FliH
MLTDVFRKHREVEKMGFEQAKKDVVLDSREKVIEANERFLNAGQRHFFDRREHREHIPAVDLIFDQAREEGLILGRAEADEAVANLKYQERLNELQQEENDLRQNMWLLQNKEILEAQLRSELEQEMQGQIDAASYQQGLTDGMKNGHEDGRKQGFLEGFRAASESFAHVAALHHGIALPQARVAPTENFLQRFPVPDKGHVDSQALINKSDNATASEDWEKKNGLAGNGHLSDERPKPVAEAAVPGPPVDLFNTTTVDKGYKNLQRPK